ncbi:PLDc N-terminal domain-containing protein [Chelatococcus reniformis]|uniref:Membrane protein n=1 Tax=Chelatococcus reniformis TaxID=1494448 RepID=A0A916UMZ1_9HYPH|nr:PLDc N-terminal domain-containing protein [Chelatococcus reniformis]GGC76860.1 membrane protein [Chelatococcus reniformis]
MLFEGGFTFTNFLVDVLAIFVFIMWFWLLMTVIGDLFRRSDVSGLGKIVWIVVLILLPYIGIFAYLLLQGRSMAERAEARAQHARDELRQIVGFSVADEIGKLETLKSQGSISADEFQRLRAKLV